MLYATTTEDPNARGKGRDGAGDGADDFARCLADEQARLQTEKDEAARRGKGTDGRGDGADGHDGKHGHGDSTDGRGDGADGRGGLGLGDKRDASGKYGQGEDSTVGSGKNGKSSGIGLGGDGLSSQSAVVGSGGDGAGTIFS